MGTYRSYSDDYSPFLAAVIIIASILSIACAIWFYTHHSSFVEDITVKVTHKQFTEAQRKVWYDDEGDMHVRYTPERNYVWLRYKEVTSQVDSRTLFNKVQIGDSIELNCTIWVNNDTEVIHSFYPNTY